MQNWQGMPPAQVSCCDCWDWVLAAYHAALPRSLFGSTFAFCLPLAKTTIPRCLCPLPRGLVLSHAPFPPMPFLLTTFHSLAFHFPASSGIAVLLCTLSIPPTPWRLQRPGSPPATLSALPSGRHLALKDLPLLHHCQFWSHLVQIVN